MNRAVETLRLAAGDDATRAIVLEALGAGHIVAMPSETVYGLFGDATNSAAVARIYAAKGRPMFNPLISHCATRETAAAEGVFAETANRLADAFWPGPLTLVVSRRATGTACDLACAGLATIGLRVPSAPFLAEALAAFGRPLAGPSANMAGRLSPTSARAVADDLDGRIAAIVDGGDAPVGIESTVLACVGDDVRLLRPGAVTAEAIADVLGRPPLLAPVGDDALPASPGQLSSHYAPNAPVRLGIKEVYPGEALLAFGPDLPAGADHAVECLNLSGRGDLTRAAANLYRCLRALDRFDPTAIAVAPIPEAGLGAAIMDRLRRAAADRDPPKPA